MARSSEIENLAEEVRAENRAMALLREKITLTRRDIVKMIETALEEGVSGDWDERASALCDALGALWTGAFPRRSGGLGRGIRRAGGRNPQVAGNAHKSSKYERQ